ncbi:glycoside hydrolase family 15 protein [Paenibacillus hamazuiensis]|uniref:glycoside hydrolase family 15 protein n=1 Tax=Paenibacillus hamazuiensis TaxID=2936508 RepID=UPI00200D2EBE|nr:glycoside hydrolase family 15 protein [Paenibacillus hamazuiensis]
MNRLRQLVERSIQIIKLNQHPSGSYVACPMFLHYGYSWLRDGTFIAYAMDCSGEHDSALKFYEWVDRVVGGKKEQIRTLLQRHREHQFIPQNDYLNARYHLGGGEDYSEWGHFQLDGYGTWLWGLSEHVGRTGNDRLIEKFRETIEATADYLQAFWMMPNFDCWEEHGDSLHPSTLACIYGGLKAAEKWLGRPDLGQTCEDIRKLLLAHAVHDGHFVKNFRHDGQGGFMQGNTGVDASLLWLAVPFSIFGPEEPAMKRTIEMIKAELQGPGGGIRRYAGDTYYGGGEWLLLTAWHGWVQLKTGNTDEADKALHWIVDQSDELGRLPEQASQYADQAAYEGWMKRWGHPAIPLLWSHAMFLVLYRQQVAE